MRKPFNGKRPLWLAVVVAMLSNVPVSPSAQGPLRLRFPEQDPGGPVYARVERPFLVHNDLYAAIVFYRGPDCVPADFDLLDNVDLEGFPTDARAFRCPLTVDGFQIWTTHAFPGPPNFVLTTGSGAVPVWFVAWSELQAALADDTLLIDELRSMSSLQEGYANHFQETLQLTATAQTLSINLVASGAMTDGRSFWVNYVFRSGMVKAIDIKFR
jgi:hypothetical protein